MNIGEEINAFFVRVSDTQTEIKAITDPTFKRILLLSLLDALARCAYPNMKINRDRFVCLIDSFTQWSDKDRYSLQQLKFCLDDLPNSSKYPSFDDLMEEVNIRLQKWPEVNQFLFPKDVDPNPQELERFFSGGIEQKLEKVRYPSLVWVIRNYAVHELSHPGAGVDFHLHRPDPYYYHLTQIESGQG
jgi:hypothetical protein